MKLHIFLEQNFCSLCERCEEVFHQSIWVKLETMAKAAKIYKILWCSNGRYAKELIQPLTNGLNSLLRNKEYYKKFNPVPQFRDPKTGEVMWYGTENYSHLYCLVYYYLEACKKYPSAIIRIEII